MIKFLDLYKINARFETQFQEVFKQFLSSGHYILGNGVLEFEKNFAAYCGAKYCIGVSNGLDALILIFKAYIELGFLKEGDEVIVPANTFIASALGVIHAGLKPVFVEPDSKTFNISVKGLEKHITPKTKAVLVVHLYGQLANVVGLKKISKQHNLLLVEDAAQAHGALQSDGKMAGNLADAAGFSFYPGKNLGALGDAGAITTNNKELDGILRKLRNYGSSLKYLNSHIGYNKRMDEVQALFLNEKLKHLDQDNLKRRAIANKYLLGIKNNKVELPYYNQSKNHVFHVFAVLVKERDLFMAYLKKNNIEALIHYPIPPHKQDALSDYATLDLPITNYIHDTVVSLPISPVMSEEEVNQVIKIINLY